VSDEVLCEVFQDNAVVIFLTVNIVVIETGT
jgi:hypothetical protein